MDTNRSDMSQCNSSQTQEKIEISYDSLWKAIIRPPRDGYDEDQLGEPCFTYHKTKFVRHDYQILNSRGHIIKCSFIEQPLDNNRKKYIMPVVIYLHGNSSSRLEGLKSSSELLKKNINLFIFDFSGCGQSEGDYISLGWHEREDVRCVVDFLEKLPGVGNIGLWGRSMGAATTMLYAYSDNRIKAICLDSPFADFKQVAKELCNQYVSLPDFVVDSAMNLVKQSVKDRNELDIDKLQPIIYANKTKTPAFFVHAVNDELISLEQTLKLYEDYAGKKLLNVVEGGHNSPRPKHINEKIAKFLSKYLNMTEEDLSCDYLTVNDYLTNPSKCADFPNNDFTIGTSEKEV